MRRVCDSFNTFRLRHPLGIQIECLGREVDPQAQRELQENSWKGREVLRSVSAEEGYRKDQALSSRQEEWGGAGGLDAEREGNCCEEIGYRGHCVSALCC